MRTITKPTIKKVIKAIKDYDFQVVKLLLECWNNPTPHFGGSGPDRKNDLLELLIDLALIELRNTYDQADELTPVEYRAVMDLMAGPKPFVGPMPLVTLPGLKLVVSSTDKKGA